MFFLEDINGGIWSKENGIVGDLDFATMFDTKEAAQEQMAKFNDPDEWAVMQEFD